MEDYVYGISWPGIAFATIASFLLGGVWFTLLFGKSYSAALGRDYQPREKPAAIFIIGPFIWSFLTVLTSAVLINALNIDRIGDAIPFGIIVGFGFLAATTVNTGINPNIPQPSKYGLISGSYHVISGILTAIIIALF